MTYLEFLLNTGGVFMYPLLLLSVASVYLTIATLATFRVGYLFPLKDCYAWRDNELQSMQSPLGKMLKTAPEKSLKTGVPIQNMISEQLDRLAFKLSGKIILLDQIATIAPLVGLAGTVSGIITIFSGRGMADSNVAVISSGISEALFTTLTGLAIAIPTILVKTLAARKLDKVILELEEVIFESHKRSAPGIAEKE